MGKILPPVPGCPCDFCTGEMKFSGTWDGSFQPAEKPATKPDEPLEHYLTFRNLNLKVPGFASAEKVKQRLLATAAQIVLVQSLIKQHARLLDCLRASKKDVEQAASKLAELMGVDPSEVEINLDDPRS